VNQDVTATLKSLFMLLRKSLLLELGHMYTVLLLMQWFWFFQILFVLTESSIAIRTKAMKCLTMVVEADPAVLGRNDMQRGVRHSFLDQSTSVREAAVDLVGKFVLSRPELIDKYYDMLSTRILVSPVTVTVLDITFDICTF
jgi:cohesin loading factor subunit SCC2